MGVGDMQYDLSQGFNHGGRKAGFGRMNTKQLLLVIKTSSCADI